MLLYIPTHLSSLLLLERGPFIRELGHFQPHS